MPRFSSVRAGKPWSTRRSMAFSAPIKPADAKVIFDYLSKNYGSGV
jgi:hypothetical protein